jgi:hypothetical protein
MFLNGTSIPRTTTVKATAVLGLCQTYDYYYNYFIKNNLVKLLLLLFLFLNSRQPTNRLTNAVVPSEAVHSVVRAFVVVRPPTPMVDVPEAGLVRRSVIRHFVVTN